MGADRERERERGRKREGEEKRGGAGNEGFILKLSCGLS